MNGVIVNELNSILEIEFLRPGYMVILQNKYQGLFTRRIIDEI